MASFRKVSLPIKARVEIDVETETHGTGNDAVLDIKASGRRLVFDMPGVGEVAIDLGAMAEPVSTPANSPFAGAVQRASEAGE